MVQKAREWLDTILKIAALIACIAVPWGGWSLRQIQVEAENARKEAMEAKAELAAFKGWHSETMIRRDYLDARFKAVEDQITLLRQDLEYRQALKRGRE